MYTININGKITGIDQALVPVLDRGFLYGDSVYEVALGLGERPVLLLEHLNRLEHSASMIGMQIKWGRSQLEQEIVRTLKVHNKKESYIRIIVTRGEGELALDPDAATDNNIVIIVKNVPEFPKRWWEKGMDVAISTIVRNSKDAMDPNIKSGNYLNNILAMREAKRKGMDDAIMLNHEGLVAEGTTSNVWIVKNDTFITPTLQVGILDGITRRVLLEICKINKLSVFERDFTAQELKNADECFLTSTIKGVVPVAKIDGQTIGSGLPGKWAKFLESCYRRHILSPLEEGEKLEKNS